MVDGHIHDKRKKEKQRERERERERGSNRAPLGFQYQNSAGECVLCVYVCTHIHSEKRFMGFGPLKSTSSFRVKRKKKNMEGEGVKGRNK
jgi:succinate dehydrogenase/fumarate reductase-like Fe-S protein